MTSFEEFPLLIFTSNSPIEEIRHWAEKGHADAQHVLARRYGFGQGVDMNFFKFRYWLEQSANRGHVRAMYELSQLLLMEKDNEKALKLLQKSCYYGGIKAYLFLKKRQEKK